MSNQQVITSPENLIVDHAYTITLVGGVEIELLFDRMRTYRKELMICGYMDTGRRKSVYWKQIKEIHECT